MVYDFDLPHCPYYQEELQCIKSAIPESTEKKEPWATKMLREGVPVDEVSFVFTVLNPDPVERWTAEDIIRSGFLDALQKKRF